MDLRLKYKCHFAILLFGILMRSEDMCSDEKFVEVTNLASFSELW